jgi:hypothetical protein
MSSLTETLTIHLPEFVARRLRRVAEIARRPVDEVAVETLCASLPPCWRTFPPHSRRTWHVWKPSRARHSVNRSGDSAP